MKETKASSWNGLFMLLVLLAALVGSLVRVVTAVRPASPEQIVLGLVGAVVSFFLLAGLFMVEPNQGRVLTLFGSYRGSERRALANRVSAAAAASLRAR